MKVIIFTCESNTIWDESFIDPEDLHNIIVIEYNSLYELINKVQTLDYIIKINGGNVGLVIADKINYFFEKNIEINMIDQYFNHKNRATIEVTLNKKKVSGKKNSSLSKNFEFKCMKNVVKNLLNHHVKFNFNLIITQFDYSRINFLSSLKYRSRSEIQDFYKDNCSFEYQLRLSHIYQIQIILPKEEFEDEDLIFAVLKTTDFGSKIFYFDADNTYSCKDIKI